MVGRPCVRVCVRTDRRSPEVALTPWCFEAQSSLEALGMAGLRALGPPLRMVSMSSYVDARGNGKIEWHTWK